MSEDRKQDKVEGEAASEAAQPAGDMSGERQKVDGAEVTKTGGAGEPPGGYADADKSTEHSAASSDKKESAAESSSQADSNPSPAEAAEAPEVKRSPKEPGDAPAAEKAAPSDAEKEAKAKAAAEARAARARERAAKAEAEAPAEPKAPSPNQPLLDRLVAILKDIGEDAVEEAYVNEAGGHVPCVVVKPAVWPAAAELVKTHAELSLNYLRNVSGVDLETHMEVVYHLISLETKREYWVKIRANREAPSVPSATPVWPTADWNEREIYDLFGIDFPGHPDLRRIMMSDDWVGHPLRKDYEPLDPEV